MTGGAELLSDAEQRGHVSGPGTEDRPQRPGRLLTRGEGLALLAILLVGVLLRASYLLELMQAPDFERPFLDPQFYDYWARGLVTGDWAPPSGANDPLIPSTPFVRPPGYPYFLALVYLVTHQSYLGVRIIQMGLGLVNAVLMFFLGRAVFGRTVGLVAAAFMSVYWIFIFFEGELNAPVAIVFLVLCIMHALRSWPGRLSVPRGIIPGVLLGLLTLIRPEAILFVGVVLVWGWWVSRGQGSWWRRGAALVGFLCGVAIAIAPVTMRNYRVGKEFVLICSGGGVNLYGANNEVANGTWPMVYLKGPLGLSRSMNNYDMPTAVRAFRKKMGDETLTHSDLSRYFFKLSLDYVRKHPWRTLKLFAKKAVLFWGPNEIGNNKELQYYKEQSPTLRYMPGFPAVCVLFVLGLVLVGLDLRRTWQERRLIPAYMPMGLLVMLYIATQFGAVIPFIVPARYRVAVIPYLLLFGAYAVWRTAAWAKEREVRKTACCLVAGLVLYGVCHIEFVPYEHDLARWHYHRGWAYAIQGDYDRARVEYEQAIAANPDRARYYSAVGDLFVEEGMREEAIGWYRKAVEKDPASPEAQNNLGYELYLTGQLEEAITHFRRAVEEDFQFTVAQYNLANALVDVGDYEEAIRCCRLALETDPNDPHPDYNWGRALALQGRPAEAVARFRQAVRKNPGYAEAWNYLGFELAELGRMDEAIQAYQKAIQANPRFTLAYNNMGNLLADGGKYDEAEGYFERALEVNPNDAYADYNWGRALALQGRSEQAVARFREAVRKNPADAQVQNYLGHELARLGRLVGAADHLEQALRLEPGFVLAHTNLGHVLLQQGEFEKAMEHFLAVKRIAPDAPHADENLARARRKLRESQAATDQVE